MQNNFEKINTFDERTVAVEGRICSEYKFNNYENIVFSLDNVTLVDANSSQKINGKITVFASGYRVIAQSIQKGKTVTFLGKVSSNKYFINDMSYIANGIVANVTFVGDEIKVSSNKNLTLREKIQSFVYKKLDGNLKYSSVAYAMIFGDSSYIENNVKDVFREGGISHLLAVSGLHISILISLQLFLMRKMKINKKGIFISNLVTIFIYSYLCNFSISVVRAGAMAIISMIASLCGKHYDRLSSLSLVFCFIVCLNPAKMFGYSMILSFSCVFLITLFSHEFEKLFGKFFNKKLSRTLAVCISIEFGLGIIQLCLFGYFPILSIFSNIICVPVASFAFVLTIILTPISIILPFMSFSLKIFDYLILIVIKFSNWVSGLGLIINASGMGLIIIPICLILFFAISPFVNKRIKNKKCINKKLKRAA